MLAEKDRVLAESNCWSPLEEAPATPMTVFLPVLDVQLAVAAVVAGKHSLLNVDNSRVKFWTLS